MKLQQSFPSILPMAAPQCARMFNSFAICDLVLLPLCAPLCVCVCAWLPSGVHFIAATIGHTDRSKTADCCSIRKAFRRWGV